MIYNLCLIVFRIQGVRSVILYDLLFYSLQYIVYVLAF